MYQGEFIKAANDIAYGMPMLEMASDEHFKNFKDITYKYNWHKRNTHSSNSSVKKPNLQKEVERYIYSRPKYEKITNKVHQQPLTSTTQTSNTKKTQISNTKKTNIIRNVVNNNYVIGGKNEPVFETTEIQPIIVTQPTHQVSPEVKRTNLIKKLKEVVHLVKTEPVNLKPESKVKVTDNSKIQQFNKRNEKLKSITNVINQPKIQKPQNKPDIDNRRKEWEQIFLRKN